MKISHWSLKNNSGLHNMARDISLCEQSLGLESILVDSQNPSEWDSGVGADIHVLHSHIPNHILKDVNKLVYFTHGTFEHCFQTSVEHGLNNGYGASDPFMMLQYYLSKSDVVVTWWERQAEIHRTMCNKGKRIEIVPMGVDKSFWKPEPTRGKWAGNPSLLTAENCHYIKWPLDLFVAWPWVCKESHDATLHVHYLPRDQHKWFIPLINSNGAAYKMFTSGNIMAQTDLKNALCSTDYYVNLVRYGDFNRIGMEARACGAKVISYEGNPYSDYWITEGDQRKMAEQLVAILKGETEPRTPLEAPDIKDTASRMKEIYESL